MNLPIFVPNAAWLLNLAICLVIMSSKGL